MAAPVSAFAAFITLMSIFFLVYSIIVHANYLLLHIFALSELRKNVRRDVYKPIYQPFASPFLPGVAIIAPAYNEAPTIVQSIRSLLSVKYPNKEAIVVNDGSTDDTLERLIEAYDLCLIDAEYPLETPSERIRGVYRSTATDDLLVIDKENGGKSDALNAGVWLTDQPLFCAIDADSIVDRDGLLQVVEPFLEDPEKTVATGGTVWIANGCEIENGIVRSIGLPSSTLVRTQIIEYLRAFYVGRLGLSRLKALVLISGAFGVFRTDVVRDIGGYRHDSITEDLDLVLRIHRHITDRDYRVEFVAEPVVWTEAPSTLQALSRQRRRWYRGLIDALVTHRDMIGNRRYGRVGTYAMPSYVFLEALGPLVEGLGYVIVPLAFLFGVLDLEFLVLYFVLTTGIGVLLSWFSLFTVVGRFNRYERTRQVVTLLVDGVLENFGYRQWKAFMTWHALIEYFRGDHSWGEMERSGFGGRESESDE